MLHATNMSKLFASKNGALLSTRYTRQRCLFERAPSQDLTCITLSNTDTGSP